MSNTNDTSGATSYDPDSAPDDRAVTQSRDRNRHVAHGRDAVDKSDARAREKFGGLNLGAAFFGWIVAIGVAILLAGIVGAVLTAIGSSIEVTQSDAERSAGTIGVSTAIVLLVILALAYYAGGYVAGRMSRFDGARQGVGVWVIGLVVTVVAIALGAIFGSKYNVLERVDLPRIPISNDQLSWGGVIAGIAVILVTLLFAILGGILGHRYHNRVDRAVRH
jgi:amino acid transporter